jgi:hypothetical protein
MVGIPGVSMAKIIFAAKLIFYYDFANILQIINIFA